MTDTIDIREWKETGEELKTAIANAVADTQRLIVQTLPDKLVMTKAQFDALSGDSDMIAMYGDTGRIYQTPHNVMEVEIR